MSPLTTEQLKDHLRLHPRTTQKMLNVLDALETPNPVASLAKVEGSDSTNSLIQRIQTIEFFLKVPGTKIHNIVGTRGFLTAQAKDPNISPELHSHLQERLSALTSLEVAKSVSTVAASPAQVSGSPVASPQQKTTKPYPSVVAQRKQMKPVLDAPMVFQGYQPPLTARSGRWESGLPHKMWLVLAIDGDDFFSLKNSPELQRGGVYVLINEKAEEVYVGKANGQGGLSGRLGGRHPHIGQATMAFMYTLKGNVHLTSHHIDYLEGELIRRFTQLAQGSGFSVKNQQPGGYIATMHPYETDEWDQEIDRFIRIISRTIRVLDIPS